MKAKIVKILTDAGLNLTLRDNDILFKDDYSTLRFYKRDTEIVISMSVDYIYAQALNRVIQKDYRVALLNKEGQLRAVEKDYYVNKFGVTLQHFVDNHMDSKSISAENIDDILKYCKR